MALADGPIFKTKERIMNMSSTRAVTNRQALLYALRIELGLPLVGMHTGSTRLAAIEAPPQQTCIERSSYVIDEGIDLIASANLKPTAHEPRLRGDFSHMAGADSMEAVPVEIAKGKPLVLYK